MEINFGLFSIQLLSEPLSVGQEHEAEYSISLIFLSYIFACAGAYVGLLTSRQFQFAQTKLEAFAWQVAGAVAMGSGIWSMHFVGMQAYKLPMEVHYDIMLTILSIVPAIAASFLALRVLSTSTIGVLHLSVGSLLMGAGIGAMHYIGMAAMHTGSAMAYDPWLFLLSIAVAVFFAFVALSARTHLTKLFPQMNKMWLNPASAALMGVAISAMHYTAMAAARFYPGENHGHHDAAVDIGLLLILSNVLVFLLAILVFAAVLARKTYANQSLKQAQEALAEAESRWDFALSGSGQGVWDCKIPTKEVFYSETWRKMRGFGLDEEIDGDPEVWLKRVHPEDRDRIRETIRKQDSGELPRNFFEYREKRRDGKYIWIQSRGEPVSFDENGKPTRIIGIDIDITERKELELQVSDNLQRLNTTLENFPGGIAMFDRNLILTVTNPGFYEVTELDEHWYPTGSKLEDILRFHAERGEYGDGDVNEMVAERLAEAATFTSRQYERTRPHDGVTLQFSRTPLEQGGFVLVIEDITAKLAAEKERTQLERDLSHAQKMESLGTLASGVAHEINTPIQYVGDNIRFLQDSFSDLIDLLGDYRNAQKADGDTVPLAELEEKENEIDLEFLLEELPQSMAQSLEGISQVARIVNAIKEFSHPGQDEMAAIDLNGTIETTLTVSRNQWKYVAEVTTDLSPELPMINCYQGDINQVILNMVVNAAHAIEASGKTEGGLINVITRRDGEFAEIKISDNGSGMTEDVQHRIFDPFFTTKDIGKGTGQGLAISYAIIHQKHNGTIDCDSEAGVGTTFTIRIPIIDADISDGRAA